MKNNIIDKFKRFLIKQICKINPKYIANKAYKSVFGTDINWNVPEEGGTLIECIYWLQLYTDTSLWTLCADKLRVHEYVINKGLGHILNPIYGSWEKPGDIDWDSLPDEFVLKTNNSSGQVLIVKDKIKLDKVEAVKTLKRWLRSDYGTHDVQLHYTKIHKCILAEKLLDASNGGTTDYKIWCINGKPRYVLVVYERHQTSAGYKLQLFDLDWNNLTETMIRGVHRAESTDFINRPKSFKKMLEYAEILAEGFPEVRVDFYEQNERPVFGELTFTAGYGSFTKLMNEKLGDGIKLSNISRTKRMNRLAWYK